MDKGKVYGIIPYVAPEVLRGHPYTQASDIYSFSMIMYEVFTSGLPPYAVYDEKEKYYKEIPHDLTLQLKIMEGERPKFSTKIPQLLEDLINQCWNVDPKQRPKA